MSYEPLMVRAHLRAPVIFDRPQPLDGILAAAIIEDPDLRERSRHARFWQRCVRDRGEEGARAYFKSRGFDIPRNDGRFLPLAAWGHGHRHRMWVYCASWAMYDPDAEVDVVHFTKRFDAAQCLDWLAPEARRRVEVGKGPFKSIYLSFEATCTDTLTWFVRGDRKEVEEALWLIHSVGKKRRRGYGTIAGGEIEPMGVDASVFAPDGELMRPVPAGLLRLMGIEGDFEYRFTAYRAPYWNPRWATRCAVSGKRIT